MELFYVSTSLLEFVIKLNDLLMEAFANIYLLQLACKIEVNGFLWFSIFFFLMPDSIILEFLKISHYRHVLYPLSSSYPSLDCQSAVEEFKVLVACIPVYSMRKKGAAISSK